MSAVKNTYFENQLIIMKYPLLQLLHSERLLLLILCKQTKDIILDYLHSELGHVLTFFFFSFYGNY